MSNLKTDHNAVWRSMKKPNAAGPSLRKKYYYNKRYKRFEDEDDDDKVNKENFYRFENTLLDNNEILVEKTDGSLVITRQFVSDKTSYVLDQPLQFNGRYVPKSTKILLDNISIITSNPNFQQYLPLKFRLLNNQEIEFYGEDLYSIPKYQLNFSDVLKNVVNNEYSETSVNNLTEIDNDFDLFLDIISDIVNNTNETYFLSGNRDLTIPNVLFKFDRISGTITQIISPPINSNPSSSAIIIGDNDNTYSVLIEDVFYGSVYNPSNGDIHLDSSDLAAGNAVHFSTYDFKGGYLTINNIYVNATSDILGLIVEVHNNNDLVYGHLLPHTMFERYLPIPGPIQIIIPIKKSLSIPVLENRRTIPNSFLAAIYYEDRVTQFYRYTVRTLNNGVSYEIVGQPELVYQLTDINLTYYDIKTSLNDLLFSNNGNLIVLTTTSVINPTALRTYVINIANQTLVTNDYSVQSDSLPKQYRNLVYFKDTVENQIVTINLTDGTIINTSANELSEFATNLDLNDSAMTFYQYGLLSTITNTRDGAFYRVNSQYDGRELSLNILGASTLNLLIRTSDDLPLKELEIIKIVIDFRIYYTESVRKVNGLYRTSTAGPHVLPVGLAAGRREPREVDLTGYLDEPQIKEPAQSPGGTRFSSKDLPMAQPGALLMNYL